MAAGKYLDVANRLSRRILAGDYHFQTLPAERELALEVGVSHLTARKAVQKLLDEGLLRRLENGRLAVQRGDADSKALTQIGLLVPAWESNETARWQIALAQLCRQFNCSARTVYYAHLDDPLLFNSLQGFDGAFFMPTPEALPDHFIEDFRAIDRPIVVLRDWTQFGIPSLLLYSPVNVQRVLDHMASLGRQEIDCFNVAPQDPTIAAYISQWNIWRKARDIGGELIDAPVPPYTETLKVAYEVMARRLAAGEQKSNAIFCTTERVAAGAMRALADAGKRPGTDVAVCTLDGAGRAEYSIPSLTSLRTPDPKPYLSVCLEWMAAGPDRKWRGPLMVQPADVELEVRESTVPAFDASHTPRRVVEAAGKEKSNEARVNNNG